MPANLDVLTARVVTFVETVSRRAVTAATIVLATVAAIVIATTVLGLVVLGGPIRAFFIVVALVFGSVAIGAAWIGRWRLGVSGRKLPELTNELHQLLAANPDARAAVNSLIGSPSDPGSVVDAYVVDDASGEVIVAETNPVAVRGSNRRWGPNNARALLGLRSLAGDGIAKFGAIASVVGGARSYPFLAFWSLVIAVGFAATGCLLFIVYLIQLVAG